MINFDEIQEQQIESEELYFNPGFLQKQTATIYSVLPNALSLHADPDIFSNPDLVAGGSFFQLNLNVIQQSRSIYNGLDFLGDVGGL